MQTVDAVRYGYIYTYIYMYVCIDIWKQRVKKQYCRAIGIEDDHLDESIGAGDDKGSRPARTSDCYSLKISMGPVRVINQIGF